MPHLRTAPIVLGLASALLFTLWLGARDLWNPNEPTYGLAVAEMARNGEWLVPTVHGAVFGEKPIFYYWMARAAALAWGGVNEVSLRLPSALSGLAAVLLLYLLVQPYAGRRRATIAGILLATTFIVFWSARQVQMDLLVATTTLATVLCATRVLDHRLRPTLGWGLAGIAAGLGFLAKGPVGLICPGLVLTLYAVSSGRWRALLRPPVAIAGVACVVVIAPWCLALLARDETAVLVEFVYRQNVTRFVDPWDHQAPWWYYLKYFWIDLAPWSFFLPLALALPAVDEGERRLNRLAWSWILVLIVFFSLSASKRSPYILPVAPAVAILLSTLAERWCRGELDVLRRRLALVLHGLFAVALAAGAAALIRDSRWTGHVSDDIRNAAWITAIVAGCGALAILVGMLAPWRRRLGAPLALLAFVVTIYLVAVARVLPAVDAVKSPRAFGEAVRERVADAEVRGLYDWKWRAGYAYYAERAIPPLESEHELRGYWAGPGPVFLVVERGRLDEARRVIGAAEPIESRPIGNNHAYLFRNR